MNLGQLLKELRQNILRDRSNQLSGPSDQLWDDDTLVTYINEAQREFARLTGIIKDADTPVCCSLQLSPGVIKYKLHPSVISVFSAKYTSDQGDLARAGHSGLSAVVAPDTTFFDPSKLGQLPPGKVVAFGTDESVAADANGSFSVVTFRAYPVPAAAYTTDPIQLRVSRLPINELTRQNLAAFPEIPADYHLRMLDWAAYLALRVGDHDAEDYKRALNFKALFEESIDSAKKTARLKGFAPAKWSFGKNAFSYQGEGYQ